MTTSTPKRLIGFSEARPVYLPAELHALLKDLAEHEGKGLRVLLVEVLLRGGLSRRLLRAFPGRREEILRLVGRLGDANEGLPKLNRGL